MYKAISKLYDSQKTFGSKISVGYFFSFIIAVNFEDEHFGPEETLVRLSEKYIWNQIAESVNNFVAGCCKKPDEESGTPKALINRNVDFFNKQFLNGV